MAKKRVGARGLVGGRALKSQELGKVKIKGVDYVIISEDTPASMAKRGLNRVAEHLREQNITRTLGIQRPNGSKVFMVEQFANGAFNAPRSLGR